MPGEWTVRSGQHLATSPDPAFLEHLLGRAYSCEHGCPTICTATEAGSVSQRLWGDRLRTYVAHSGPDSTALTPPSPSAFFTGGPVSPHSPSETPSPLKQMGTELGLVPAGKVTVCSCFPDQRLAGTYPERGSLCFSFCDAALSWKETRNPRPTALRLFRFCSAA